MLSSKIRKLSVWVPGGYFEIIIYFSPFFFKFSVNRARKDFLYMLASFMLQSFVNDFMLF